MYTEDSRDAEIVKIILMTVQDEKFRYRTRTFLLPLPVSSIVLFQRYIDDMAQTASTRSPTIEFKTRG